MQHNPIRTLIDVLDREGDALRAGDLSALPAIAEEKIQLSAEISKHPATGRDLEILRAKASANASLLAAAIRGIRAARNRLDALSEVRDVLSVYDPSGQIQRVPTKRSDVERKA